MPCSTGLRAPSTLLTCALAPQEAPARSRPTKSAHPWHQPRGERCRAGRHNVLGPGKGPLCSPPPPRRSMVFVLTAAEPEATAGAQTLRNSLPSLQGRLRHPQHTLWPAGARFCRATAVTEVMSCSCATQGVVSARGRHRCRARHGRQPSQRWRACWLRWWCWRWLSVRCRRLWRPSQSHSAGR